MKLPRFNPWHIVALVATIVAAGTKLVGDLANDQEKREEDTKKIEEA